MGTLLCLCWFFTIQSQNCTIFVHLDSLLCEEGFDKFLDLFSTGWNSWETEPAGLLGSVIRNGNKGTLLCLYWFLVIRIQNYTLFVLLDS